MGNILVDKYIEPPFTVLNAGSTRWMTRKNQWINATGMDSSDGRDDELTYGIPMSGNSQALKNAYDLEVGRKTTWAEFIQANQQMSKATTSIFDPVLTELLVNWFSPIGGVVLDPFAGGVVRGAVSAMIGREYHGVDLSERQIKANREQWNTMTRVGTVTCEPVWIHGDSANISDHGIVADMILSCPPYHDLEVYSDDENDLSNMSYDDFIIAYRKIILETVSCLRENSFAAFVVGDIRYGKHGLYRNFVSHTISAFEDAGAFLYNEAVLFTALGSLPIRTGGQFEASRKMGKGHQNVLVFVKGDPKIAAAKCLGGVVDVFGVESVTQLDDLFV